MDWLFYGADATSSRFAPVEQITADNLGQLEVAWRWTSPDEAIRAARPELWTRVNESTPLMVDGTLCTGTSLSPVAAIDAVTGTTR